MAMVSFQASSRLAIPADEFLRAISLRQVNFELAPWVRMTGPASMQDTNIREWPVRQRLFTSWILLFGVLPVDLHWFFLESVDPSKGFHEHSSSVVNRTWLHIRVVEPSPGRGCTVTDSVSFESRVPGLGYIMRPIYRLVFQSRHTRLRRKHGLVVA